MVSDFYLIFLTALAIFGLYSIVKEVMLCFRAGDISALLIVVDGSDETMAYQSADYIKNLLADANVVVLTDKQNIGVDIETKTKDELMEYITNDLFTKN